MAKETYYEPLKTAEERFFLVGLTLPKQSFDLGEKTLEELGRLADTAGAKIAGKEHVRLREISPANFIGTGQAEQLALLAEESGATGVVFDEDLSPAQNRNLEEMFDKKVLDRTTLILDIFARRAHSREGKLQVELAQLEYLLPRLRGMGTVLSRLGGGIGTRGPGETKLETDRRRIENRISSLKKEIKSIARHRTTQRRLRQKRDIFNLSLIGYTNAGKSTLLNALTDAHVLVEDKLFSTLDPTAKKLLLPSGREAVLVDTVGFIRKLPHTLIAAFRATLEEIKYADVLLMVADASSPLFEEEIKACHDVLAILQITDKPLITIMNKLDLVADCHSLTRHQEELSPCVLISAKNRSGLEELLTTIDLQLKKTRTLRLYQVPYHRFDLLARVQSHSKQLKVEYDDECIKITVVIDTIHAEKLEQDPDLLICEHS